MYSQGMKNKLVKVIPEVVIADTCNRFIQIDFNKDVRCQLC
jgi:hypothetical protein